MKSNGGVLSAEEVVNQPITTVLSGPAAGALGAALIAREAGFDKVLTCDGGGTSTDVSVVLDGEATLTTEGTIGQYPSKIPMIDIVTVGAGGGSVAWVSPEGALKVGPRSAGADPGPLCYGTRRHRADGHRRPRRARPHPAAPARRRDPARRRGRPRRAGGARGQRLGLTLEACATGILEISAWNQANALRQVTVKRGLDVRDFTMATFGGSGSLLLCRLVDMLGLAGVLVPRDPGNVSAFGLLTVDVRNDYVRTAVSRHADLDVAALAGIYDELQEQAAASLDREGFAPRPSTATCAAPTCATRARPSRCACPRRDGPVDEAFAERSPRRSTRPTSSSTATRSATTRGSRSSGSTCGCRASARSSGRGRATIDAREGDEQRARTGTRPVFFDDWVDTPVYWRPDLASRRRPRRTGGHRGVRLDRAAASRLPGPRRPLRQPRRGGKVVMSVDPVLLEIVEGSLAAIEKEVETAIGRTARSPMIRDAHDFRAGIHDRRLRKLTGRSYSALVHPVARDFPLETMRPGDVFFHNDVYLSEGGIGHLPDLCVTVPVFVGRAASGAEVVASCRPSATTTTSGERCRARCRRTPPRCSRRA